MLFGFWVRLAIAEKPSRNCQWLQSSERTMADVQCQWLQNAVKNHTPRVSPSVFWVSSYLSMLKHSPNSLGVHPRHRTCCIMLHTAYLWYSPLIYWISPVHQRAGRCGSALVYCFFKTVITLKLKLKMKLCSCPLESMYCWKKSPGVHSTLDKCYYIVPSTKHNLCRIC